MERNAEAGPSSPTLRRRRAKASKPFVSAHHRPETGVYDGVFRVVIITSGSVASVKLPLIVGALCRVCPVSACYTSVSNHLGQITVIWWSESDTSTIEVWRSIGI